MSDSRATLASVTDLGSPTGGPDEGPEPEKKELSPEEKADLEKKRLQFRKLPRLQALPVRRPTLTA